MPRTTLIPAVFAGSVLVAVRLLASPGAAGEVPAGAAVNVLERLQVPLGEDVPVSVETLSGSPGVSVQLVRVRDEVRPHLHERHAETVYILRGRGAFTLGDRVIEAGPGDVFVVPPGTVHAFRVTGEGPAAALTTFSPGYDGEDRVYVETPGPQN